MRRVFGSLELSDSKSSDRTSEERSEDDRSSNESVALYWVPLGRSADAKLKELASWIFCITLSGDVNSLFSLIEK